MCPNNWCSVPLIYLFSYTLTDWKYSNLPIAKIMTEKSISLILSHKKWHLMLLISWSISGGPVPRQILDYTLTVTHSRGKQIGEKHQENQIKCQMSSGNTAFFLNVSGDDWNEWILRVMDGNGLKFPKDILEGVMKEDVSRLSSLKTDVCRSSMGVNSMMIFNTESCHYVLV